MNDSERIDKAMRLIDSYISADDVPESLEAMIKELEARNSNLPGQEAEILAGLAICGMWACEKAWQHLMDFYALD